MANKNNGFRDGKLEEAREKLRANLSEAELERIKQTREMDNVPKGSISYKLAMMQDPLMIELRNNKFKIQKMVWNIRNVNNQIARGQSQLDTNTITELVPETNVVMSKEELITWMKHMTWIQDGEVTGIPTFLMKVRAIVGHNDYEGKSIITEVEFDEYVTEVETEIKELGFSIF